MSVLQVGGEGCLNGDGANALRVLKDMAEGRRQAVLELRSLSKMNVGLRLEWQIAVTGPQRGFALLELCRKTAENLQRALSGAEGEEPCEFVSSDELFGRAADTVDVCCSAMADVYRKRCRGAPLEEGEMARLAVCEAVAYLVFSGELCFGMSTFC